MSNGKHITGLYQSAADLRIRNLLDDPFVPEATKDAIVQQGLAEVQADRRRYREDAIPEVEVRQFVTLQHGNRMTFREK